jgi:hypothetical protein
MRERDLLKATVPNGATLMRVTDPLVLKIQHKLTSGRNPAENYPWTFTSPGGSLKTYPSGSLTHLAITAMLRLVQKFNIARLT